MKFKDFINENVTSWSYVLKLDPASGEDRAKLLKAAEDRGINVLSEKDEDGYVQLELKPSGSEAAVYKSHAEKDLNATFKVIAPKNSKADVMEATGNFMDDIEELIDTIHEGDFVEARFKQTGNRETYFESFFVQGDVKTITNKFIQIEVTHVTANDESTSGGINAKITHPYTRKFYFTDIEDLEVRGGVRITLK